MQLDCTRRRGGVERFRLEVGWMWPYSILVLVIAIRSEGQV